MNQLLKHYTAIGLLAVAFKRGETTRYPGVAPQKISVFKGVVTRLSSAARMAAGPAGEQQMPIVFESRGSATLARDCEPFRVVEIPCREGALKGLQGTLR
jgi:hypothetical protein